jgi:Zn-dependent M28 family amino/carboxypeptidase
MRNAIIVLFVLSCGAPLAGIVYKVTRSETPPAVDIPPELMERAKRSPLCECTDCRCENCTCNTVPEKPKKLDAVAAVATVTEKDAKEIVYWLADDAREGRMTGKKGNREAAAWIKARFDSFGLKTEYQSFPVYSGTNPGPKNEAGEASSNNVIATLPGKTERKIVVTSHLDHVGYGPRMALDKTIAVHNGADDNASGCAGVLEVAEAMSKMEQPKHTIIFICFSGEEMGLVGSKHYVSHLSKDDVSKIDLAVNFDMIGRMNEKKTVQAIGARKNQVMSNFLMQLEKKYAVNMGITTGDGDDNSDHAPFRHAGVPICFFFTGLHNDYHRVSDDADKINYNGLVVVARMGLELVLESDKTTNR